MDIDPITCSRARRSRDPRFDGRFFVAVRTTGIYCRPICPAPSPKEQNVRYYPTAAAAAEAGFRPCLRCRPETSPGTPAWIGTSVTVARALRLMNEGPIEERRVEQLASRLGIGGRHLRRLFLQHLGATPIAVAQTRRLHFAKRLIDETELPFAEIAFAAGFGSIRRFNAAFRRLYDRTPTELRRLAQRHGAGSRHGTRATDGRRNGDADVFRLRLGYRPPFDWNGLLEFFATRAIPGVEIVESGAYRRTIELDGRVGEIEARLVGASVEVAIRFPDARALVTIVERVRRLFDLDADPEAIARQLRRDPRLASRVRARRGWRVPGAWDPFELSIRAILGQQITVRAASTLAGRLTQRLGRPYEGSAGLTRVFPAADRLMNAPADLLPMPRARADTIRRLAAAVANQDLSFAAVSDGRPFVERMRDLRGIGSWTAHYVAMRALGEPDAFPTGDLGLLRATGLDKPAELERVSQAWRPWRAYAAVLLWQAPGRPERKSS